MLNGRYCGNCANWTDAVPTAKGKLPYYGKCAAGRPKKAGQLFTRTYNGGKYRVRYNDFTVRTDTCEDWRAI